MKSTLVSSEGIKKVLKIEVEAETVSSAFEAELKKVGKKATLPGFRKGKAPMSAVRASYGKSVIPDVIESLVNKNYFLALKEHDLHPVNSPHIDFENIVDGQGFVFSAQVETKPNISLKKYKSFNFKKETLSIEDSQVQSTLNKILESSAKKIPILENRSAQDEDFVDINFEGTLSDNTPLPNGSANNFILELGSQSFIPGFEEGIEGMKPEEEKILNVTFPEDYHAKDIAGQNVSFKIKLNKIMKKSLPELTDEFVISLKEGDLKTVEELKTKIRDNIEESEKIRIKNDLHEKVLKTLVENNPIELPPS